MSATDVTALRIAIGERAPGIPALARACHAAGHRDDLVLAALADSHATPEVPPAVAMAARAELELRVAARALEVAPHAPELWRGLVSAALEAGRLGDAVRGLELISQEAPAVAPALWAAAIETLVAEGFAQLARAVASAATRALPADASSWSVLALLELDRDLAAAKTAADTAYVLAPTHALTWLALAAVASREGRPLRAEAAARTAIERGAHPAEVEAIVFAHLARTAPPAGAPPPTPPSPRLE